MPTVAALAAHELEAHGGQCCAGAVAAGAELVLVDDNMHLRSMRQACYRWLRYRTAATTLVAAVFGRYGTDPPVF